MRVLAVHSAYRQRGGEDASFDVECQLLRASGHEVTEFVVESVRLGEMSPVRAMEAVARGANVADEIGTIIKRTRPDVAYVNNPFPSVGPLAMQEILELPTVVAVRNHRFECLIGICFRKGQECRACPQVGNYVPGIAHACYQGSVVRSSVAAVALSRTWTALRDARAVRYACVSRYISGRLMAARHVPDASIDIKPNTTERGFDGASERRRQVLVVGRLEPEKGIGLLLEHEHVFRSLPLVFVGNGSLQALVEEACSRVPGWQYVGIVSRREVAGLLAESRATLVPSLVAESFGRVAVESLAVGTPVVVSNRGGLPEIVGDSDAGVVVDPDSPRQMLSALGAFLDGGPAFEKASASAHQRFESAFSPDRVGEILLAIFEQAIEQSDARKKGHDLRD